MAIPQDSQSVERRTAACSFMCAVITFFAARAAGEPSVKRHAVQPAE